MGAYGSPETRLVDNVVVHKHEFTDAEVHECLID